VVPRVADVNNDGWQDLYVHGWLKRRQGRERTLLYINQGAGKDGICILIEMAAEYGLNDTHAFHRRPTFDYDNHGDLDMYLVVNEIQVIIRRSSAPNTPVLAGIPALIGRFIENDYDVALRHPVFERAGRPASFIGIAFITAPPSPTSTRMAGRIFRS